MNTRDLALILMNIPYIGRERTKYIMKNYRDSTDLYSQINDLFPTLSVKRDDIHKAEYKALCQKTVSEKMGIKIYSHTDDFYPDSLKAIKDFPPLIYVKGNTALLNMPLSAALIGSRKSTIKILQMTELIGEHLVSRGFTIISGLALGCDRRAHETALKEKSYTIAVMPCGPDVIYPSENAYLYRDILEKKGMIFSEYSPSTNPAPFRFVDRDRLQSGLSHVVILMESTLNGGSMYTAASAIRQRRPLLVYQPVIHSYRNSGNRRLIDSGRAFPFKNLEEFVFLLNKMHLIIRDCNRESDQLIFPYA